MTNFRTCPECFSPTKDPGICERCRWRESSRFLVLIVVLSLGLIALCQSCRGSVVTEPFLDSIAQRESGNNPSAIGRAGELGAYQLKRCAVAQVNSDRGWRMPFRRAAIDHGRAYCRAYCLYIERLLLARLGRAPTPAEIYTSYQRGPFAISSGPSAATSRATSSPLRECSDTTRRDGSGCGFTHPSPPSCPRGYPVAERKALVWDLVNINKRKRYGTESWPCATNSRRSCMRDEAVAEGLGYHTSEHQGAWSIPRNLSGDHENSRGHYVAWHGAKTTRGAEPISDELRSDHGKGRANSRRTETLGLTASHRVPGSIPEQAISCAGREGNGQSMATTCKCSKGERQPDSVPVGAKGVTAGETASIYDLVV